MRLLSFLAVTSALVFSANAEEGLGNCKEIGSIINRNETTNELIHFNGNITIFAMLNSSVDACIETAELINDLQHQLLSSQYYQINFAILDTANGTQARDRQNSQELIYAAGNVAVLSNAAYNITGWLQSQQDYIHVVDRCGRQVFQLVDPCSVKCSHLKTAIFTTLYDNLNNVCGDCEVPYAVAPTHTDLENFDFFDLDKLDNCGNLTIPQPTTEAVTIVPDIDAYLNKTTSTEQKSAEDKNKSASKENKQSSEEKTQNSSEKKDKSSEEKIQNSSEVKNKSSSEEKNRSSSEKKIKNSSEEKNTSEEKTKNSFEGRNKSSSEELVISTTENSNKIPRPDNSWEVSKENTRPLPVNIHLDLPNIHTINYKITKHSQIPAGKNVERNVVITEELSRDGRKEIRTHTHCASEEAMDSRDGRKHKHCASAEAIDTRYVTKIHEHATKKPRTGNDEHQSIEETLNDNIIEFSNSSDVLHGFQLTDRHALFHLYKKMLPRLQELLEQRQPKHHK